MYESLWKMSEAYKSRLANTADQRLKNLTNSNAKRLSSSQTFSEIASPIRNMSSTSNSRTSIVTLLLPRNTREDKFKYRQNILQYSENTILNKGLFQIWNSNILIFPTHFLTTANCSQPPIVLNQMTTTSQKSQCKRLKQSHI